MRIHVIISIAVLGLALSTACMAEETKDEWTAFQQHQREEQMAFTKNMRDEREQFLKDHPQIVARLEQEKIEKMEHAKKMSAEARLKFQQRKDQTQENAPVPVTEKVKAEDHK